MSSVRSLSPAPGLPKPDSYPRGGSHEVRGVQEDPAPGRPKPDVRPTRVAGPQLACAALSDVGSVRPYNEDRWRADDYAALYVVADGMGGYNAGEIAADLAVETVGRLIPELLARDCGFADALQGAIAASNTCIRDFAAAHPDCLGMGTTIVACLVRRDRLHIAHIGDSRAYRLRGGMLHRLTRDHSIGQQIADAGSMSEARVRLLPARGILTRALGIEASVDCEVASVDWMPSDTLLLCSDGLSDPLTDGCIRQLLIDHACGGPSAQVDALIRAAMAAGGADNLTALVVRAVDAGPLPAPMH